MPKRKWLKKYSKLEYLKSTLTECQLHLGNPSEWPDKNDSECIRIYSDGIPDHDIRGTCLTDAEDRFHFWHIFGECELGVCLWFDKKSLIRDIAEDKTIVSGEVHYCRPKELSKLKHELIPFAKREQYRDESEFRILRMTGDGAERADKFSFSASSLKRIYINPWLAPKDVNKWKGEISGWLKGNLEHVCIKQNRSLRNKEWIEAVSSALKKNG